MYTKPIAAAVAALLLALSIHFLLDHNPPVVTLFDERSVDALEALPTERRAEIEALEKRNSRSEGSERAETESEVARLWEASGHGDIAAHHLRLAAEADPTAARWQSSGDAFFDAFIQVAEDDDMRVNLAFHAIYSYEKLLELEPDRPQAKLRLGQCYIEGTSRFMDGVVIIRQVAEQNPDNLEAQFLLGRFSLMSGQYAKAAERFETVLSKDSLNLQARYLLVESYAGTGHFEAAVEALERGLSVHKDDPQVVVELEMAIARLKQ